MIGLLSSHDIPFCGLYYLAQDDDDEELICNNEKVLSVEELIERFKSRGDLFECDIHLQAHAFEYITLLCVLITVFWFTKGQSNGFLFTQTDCYPGKCSCTHEKSVVTDASLFPFKAYLLVKKSNNCYSLDLSILSYYDGISFGYLSSENMQRQKKMNKLYLSRSPPVCNQKTAGSVENGLSITIDKVQSSRFYDMIKSSSQSSFWKKRILVLQNYHVNNNFLSQARWRLQS